MNVKFSYTVDLRVGTMEETMGMVNAIRNELPLTFESPVKQADGKISVNAHTGYWFGHCRENAVEKMAGWIDVIKGVAEQHPAAHIEASEKPWLIDGAPDTFVWGPCCA